jgi:hypothetical protein
VDAQTPTQNKTRNTWTRIVAWFIGRRLRSVPDSPLDFVRFFHEPKDWLLVMPAEANAFDVVLPLIMELMENLKGVRLHLLVPYDFRHWITVTTPKLKVHPFHKQDLRLGRFPRRALLDRLHNLKTEVAMDLCPHTTPLSLSVIGASGARVRGSFSRPYGDGIFNFLVRSGAEQLEDRYRAFFAYLT